ncbi:TraC family protein [Paenirhodobacter populi]|uniref:Conjugal transfer protein TraC n=1 Tax=Paenirhodobacter populi TaxID=2306993 RepID=A0A443JR22_9RHOB|nr:TraC family protein [Sinirhodobacter populi]RWR22957.1 conjugal transfer protein TraC [Sinirhodobacter populi]
MNAFRTFFQGLFDDPDWSEDEPQALATDVVAELLPYRLYDAESELYFNENSTGFVIEVNPVVGSDDVASNLQAVINSNAPNNASIQFLNWTSPDIDAPLIRWARHRLTGDELVRQMAQRRMAHLRAARYGTDHVIKALPHHRRVFIACWLDGDADLGRQKDLRNFRRALYSVFGGEQYVRHLGPSGFLQFLGELLHCRGLAGISQLDYSEEEALNHQLPGAGLFVGRSAIGLMGDPTMGVASASVRRYPREWQFVLGMLLNGVPERIADRPTGPVLTSFTMRVRSKSDASGFLMKKRAGLQHTASTQFARFSANLTEKMAEFDGLNEAVEMGEKLVDSSFIVCTYAMGGGEDARHALAEMAKIYRYAGLVLENDTFVQLPIFLAALPFTTHGKRMEDLKKLQRIKILKSEAAAALVPVHGEWTGSGSGRGVLLLGRQGQIMDWDNFLSDGNYNVAVVGKSGAGKSVFMQELVTSIYAAGGKVVVIDDGYSFRTTAEILGGKFVGFDGSSLIRLNPFSMLSAADMAKDEYRADAIELVTRIIASMAALGEGKQSRVEDLEEGFIARIVGELWDAKGPAAEVTDVWQRLSEIASEDQRLLDVVVKLQAFTREGPYGVYFSGPANLTLDANFTVFELSNIKGQKVLQDVVLQMIMFLGTELMFKTDRSTPVAILIDEAWDLLQSHATARFIEGVVRRARKYTGALITGTQSIDDYYNNVAATVCLQNSDWTVLLAQKAETIDRLVADKRLSVSPHIAGQLKSLQSVKGQFSEMGIKGPGGWFFGRLLLDPFSLAVYSSKGSTVEKLRRLKDQGYSTVEAIRILVEEGAVE